ncbi:MAG: NAD(P)/FAD-dependent oxidoreductase, partial [Pseudobdellovibrionaceae bacterium]
NRELLMEYVIEDQSNQVEFSQTGSCTIASNQEQWLKYKEIATVMKANSIEIEEIESEEITRKYGVHEPNNDFPGGIEYKADGVVHPIKLLNRLKSKLRVDIYENTEVFDIQATQGLQHIKSDQGVFETPKLILTLNAYLPLVLKNFKKVLTPNRGQILVTEPLPQFVKGPCYFNKNLCYFRQLSGGHLLVGGFRNLSTETENSHLDQTTDIIQKALLQFIKECFKYGTSAKIAYQWSGIMGFTPDEQMLIGSLPQNPGIHLMAGCSGHGMGLSFHAAKILVGSLFGRPIPGHLNLLRFSGDF